MKDLQSIEHYCYKIHTLLMKGSVHPSPLYRQHPITIFTRKSWLTPPSIIFQKFQPHINKAGVCALWRLMVQKNLQSKQRSEVFYKLTKLLKGTLSYVAIMCENCVIDNPLQLNPCEYGWEINEGEKSLKPTLLPTGIKIAHDKILQTRCKCISTQCK